MTGLPNHDVVFVRFQNEAISHQCLPYFIAIDEHSNSVGKSSLHFFCRYQGQKFKFKGVYSRVKAKLRVASNLDSF